MPVTNHDMDTVGGIFQLPITINGATEQNLLLQTENKFIDKNIGITVTTPAASGFSVSSISGSSDVSVGTKDSTTNKYPITANNLSVTAAMSSAGWIDTSSMTDGDTDGCAVGTMAAAAASISATTAAPTLVKITQAVTNKTQILNTVDPATGTSGISTYYIAVQAQSGAVTQGTPTVGAAGYLADASQITVNGITAGNQNTTYYIPVPSGTFTNNQTSGTSAGTINRGQLLKIGKGWYDSDTYYTAQANSGTKTITSSGTISVDGYVNATVAAANLSGTATADVTYNDISNTAGTPVLVANGGLYINAGYIDNTYISTAHLVPDGTDITGHREWILEGHTALDEDGILITGSMPTYLGEYTITV